MKDSAFSTFLNKYKLSVVLSVMSFIILGSVHYALNVYFQNASLEVVEGWYANERMSIQQGNVLSSVTKLQRTIEKSGLVKGVQVVDEYNRVLVRIGEVPNIKSVQFDSENISSQKIGLFFNIYGFRSGDLQICIFTESKALLYLVGLLGVYLISLMLGVSFLIRKFSMKEEKIRSEAEMHQLRLKSEFNERIVFISRRVAHDIRSPLSILNVIAAKIRQNLPNEGELLTDVSSRIIEIADGLLDSSRDTQVVDYLPKKEEEKIISDAEMTSHAIISLCESSIEQKKIELGNPQIKLHFFNEVASQGKITCEAIELTRILSNLLNNSIEALSSSGFVSLSLSEDSGGILIEIRDSGKGMSKELIDKAMNGPTSEGKDCGNGLGLWPAIQIVKSWGGQLSIRSGHGTTVSILLKKNWT